MRKRGATDRPSRIATIEGLNGANAWIIRRLRAYLGKQWKWSRTRVQELLQRGVSEYWANVVGSTRKGPWRLGRNTTVAQALPVPYLTGKLGLVLPG